MTKKIIAFLFLLNISIYPNEKLKILIQDDKILPTNFTINVVLNSEDDINQVSMTPEMNYFIDDWSYGIISFKTDDARCNNSIYYENKCQDIITQLTAKIN